MRVPIGSRWAGAARQQFRVVAIWTPHDQQDPWVRYTGVDSREYTCRLEAFCARFTPLPNPA
jgi:hypothetical protein